MGESLSHRQKGRHGLANGFGEHRRMSHARNIDIPGKVEGFNMGTDGERWHNPDDQTQGDSGVCSS